MSRSDQSKRAIILSPLEWERWSSRKELAISLAAAGWRVVYSNGPIQTWQVASAARQGAGLMATVTRDCGVDVVRSGLFPFHRTTPSWFSQMANSVFAKNLTTLVNDGCCVAEAITVCFDPVFANLARCIPGRTVYFVVDELSKYPNWQVSGALREREMMNVADGVVGFTASMLERILSQYPRQHLVLPLAVNPDLFEGGSAGHQPDALGAVPHPRIGWVGGINHKIDFAESAGSAESITR